jgi:hypothetical protein
MKNNITTILEKAIGKDKELFYDCGESNERGYNQAKAEMRAKIPAIQEAIVDEIKNVINKEIIIHRQLESECVGSIEDIKNGVKGENPHTFVIEQEQILKQRVINHLTK